MIETKISSIFSSLQWFLIETSKINIIEVEWFCIYMYQDRRLILHHNFDVLSNFYSVFVNISWTVKMLFIYWLHSEVGSSPVFTLSNNTDIPWENVSFPMLIHCKGGHDLQFF